jgi:hypothetical protein
LLQDMTATPAPCRVLRYGPSQRFLEAPHHISPAMVAEAR